MTRLKFPYGLADFAQVSGEGYLYIDRTDRIPLLEETGKHLLFLRPRRFGKSLLLSTLENYYDLARADQFERLFGSRAIGQNPTPLKNQYFVMKWDFSMVSPEGPVGEIKQSLHDHLNVQMQGFVHRYQDYLTFPVEFNPTNATYTFQSLLFAVQATPYKLYLLIDEYDNFANEVLMSQVDRQRDYEELVYGEGTLKSLFKVIKGSAAGRGLDRVFITGVSPLVLSDVTSGYNIARDIYFEPELNDLCGFTESEIGDILGEIIRICDLPAPKFGEVLSMMRSFYNGYRFVEAAEDYVYNPTLVLYFLDFFQKRCQYPSQMLDSNLAPDHNKLLYLSQIRGGNQVILDAVKAENPLTIQELETRFGISEMLKTTQDLRFMASLLYYFGVLTISGRTPWHEVALTVPNQVTQRLYLEAIQAMFLPDRRLKDKSREALQMLYRQGDLQAVCDFIEGHYLPVFSNRDYRWSNELTLKTLFLTVLYNDLLYFIESEVEIDRGYADLVLLRRPDAQETPLPDLLFEFKYLSSSAVDLDRETLRNMSQAELRILPRVQPLLAEAHAQLKRYAPPLIEKYGDTLNIRSIAVVGLGLERLVWEASEF